MLDRRILLVAIPFLACAPASGQTGVCSQQALRGVWALTCQGFTDLSKYNTGAPKGTLAPISMLARMVIDASGNGSGEGVGSLAGTPFSFRKQESFTVNPNCTAEKTYTLKNDQGMNMQGAARSILMPASGEIRSLILETGDVVLCEHTKISDAAPPR